MAKTTLKSLLADVIGQVRASPVPIRAVEYDPSTKKLRVEFDREARPAEQVPVSATVSDRRQPDDVPMIPGTNIPDDNSPVNALDMVMARPQVDLELNGRG